MSGNEIIIFLGGVGVGMAAMVALGMAWLGWECSRARRHLDGHAE